MGHKEEEEEEEQGFIVKNNNRTIWIDRLSLHPKYKINDFISRHKCDNKNCKKQEFPH